MHKAVLVVDDDSDIREGITELLLAHGYAVLTAQHGIEALRVLRSNEVGVIVLDLMMPVMDGADFRQAQLADRSIAHVPFILLTGRLSLLGLSQGVGAVACLRKPVAAVDLLEAVKLSGCTHA